MRERKKQIADSILAVEFGISFEQLRSETYSHPDDPQLADAWRKVRAADLGSEIVVGTFTDDEVAIITVEANGKVTWTDCYAAIGSGSNIANVLLYQREYMDTMLLEECVYRVLEAKIAAERNPYVGHALNLEFRCEGAVYILGVPFIRKTATLIERCRRLPKLKQIEPKDIGAPSLFPVKLPKSNAPSPPSTL